MNIRARQGLVTLTALLAPALALAQQPEMEGMTMSVVITGIIAGNLFVLGVVCLALYFGSKVDRNRLEVIARLIEKGHPVPREIFMRKVLPSVEEQRRLDRRRGAAESVTDSDAALVARVVGNDDRGAFELLVRRYQSLLRNFLRRLAKNDSARADDLAHETLLRAYKAMHTYAGVAKFSTWLYRIAYNAFLNDQRMRFPHAEFDEALHSPIVEDVGHGNGVLDLDRCLERLSVRQRAIFDLHYKEGSDAPRDRVHARAAARHREIRYRARTRSPAAPLANYRR